MLYHSITFVKVIPVISLKFTTMKISLFCLLLIFVNTDSFADDLSHSVSLDPVKNGALIYNHGIDSAGVALQGLTEGDIEFQDAKFNCAQCHRRSGYGSSEGGNYVLPITAVSLFNPRSFNRSDIFQKLFKENQSKQFRARMRSADQRPAYNDESLMRVIREGIDPTGRKLSLLMPRFKINDEDMAGLIAYLKTLSLHNDPGVDDNSIYFATVVSKSVNADNKTAMLATIAKYVDWLNVETKGNQRHPNFSPSYRSDLAKGFRIWKHEVWELSDNPDEWPNELAAYYKKRPVFALIGGMVDGDWQPIQEFCEINKLPGLFPITELPAIGQANHYTVYFNEGLVLEAKVIAKYLLEKKTQPIVQIYAEDDAEGKNPARIFAQILNTDHDKIIRNIPVGDIDNFRSVWIQYIKSQPQIGTIVVWPGKKMAAILDVLGADIKKIDHLFLPSTTLSADWHKRSKEIRAKIIFSDPYELPSTYSPHAFRIRAWMNTRKLEITRPTVQFNTYYALNMLQYGLEPIVDHFSRDYLLENIEHEAENALNPGTFPRLSLGPEQRFASKGAYLVQLDSTNKDSVTPVSAWIVP